MFDKSIIKIFDYLEYRHEISFIYEGKEYTFLNQLEGDLLQLEIWVENDNKFYEDICLARVKSKSAIFIDDECIEKLFKVKCFNGRSFLEIANFVEVVAIS